MNKGKTCVFCIFCIILIFVALGYYTLLLLSGACCIQCSIESAFYPFFFISSTRTVQFNCLTGLSVSCINIVMEADIWKSLTYFCQGNCHILF